VISDELVYQDYLAVDLRRQGVGLRQKLVFWVILDISDIVGLW
jgi:hypothetical protein